MRTLPVLGAALALAMLCPSPASAQKKVPDGAKVLILSGGQRDHHGYREQALYLASALEDTGHYQVTISRRSYFFIARVSRIEASSQIVTR